MGGNHVYRVTSAGTYLTVAHLHAETMPETIGNRALRDSGYRGGSLEPTEPPVTRTTAGGLAGALALTGGQRLVVVIVLAIAVLVLFVWPTVKGQDGNQSINAKRESKRRLMREVQRHGHTD